MTHLFAGICDSTKIKKKKKTEKSFSPIFEIFAQTAQTT